MAYHKLLLAVKHEEIIINFREISGDTHLAYFEISFISIK